MSCSKDISLFFPRLLKAASVGAPYNFLDHLCSMDCKSSPHWPLIYVWSRISCFRKPRKGLRALKAIAKVTSGIEIFSIHSDTITWLFSVSYYFWTFVYFFFFFFLPRSGISPPILPLPPLSQIVYTLQTPSQISSRKTSWTSHALLTSLHFLGPLHYTCLLCHPKGSVNCLKQYGE